MFSAERAQRFAPDVLVDIVAELSYWRSCYPYRRFFSVGRPFEAYVQVRIRRYLLHHE